MNDLGRAWAGGFCGRILGDLGAEVVKVESSKRPDLRGPARPSPGFGAYPNGEPGEEPWNRSAMFHERHRNKQSLTLELDNPEGRAAFLRLAAKADLVTENFSPRVMGQLGIDYSELRAVNEAIVLLSMSGFGRSGSDRDYVAFGDTLEQSNGSVASGGYPDGPPMNSGLHYSDPVVGTLAAGMSAAYVRAARRSGVGMHPDLAQIEVVSWLLGATVTDSQLGSGMGSPARGKPAWALQPAGRIQDSWRG